MGNNHNDNYILLTMQTFLQIGGNMSSYGGVILFDNYEDSTDTQEAQLPFVSKPMKMQSNVIVVCRKGFLEYRLDCGKTLTIHSGDLVFCKQGLIVEFLGASSDVRIMFIAISQDYIMSLERFMPHSDSSLSMSFTPSEEFMEDINTHYLLIKASIENTDSSFRESIIHSYIYIILVKLITAYNKWTGNRIQERSAVNRQTEIYRRFVSLVKDNFKQHRNVEYYASELFISSGHLSRVIKSISGKTIGAWIKDYVILEAKIMLQSSDMTISQISDYLNFPNSSFFSRYFHANTGMTPGQYRKS